MFPHITHLQDLHPAVAAKKEIRFFAQPYGLTLGCYLFTTDTTFDSPQARECRGIVFDATGAIVSRPLHKFFNANEPAGLSLPQLLDRSDLVALYEKLDGSLVSTAWVDQRLLWHTKKSFQSDVVRLTHAFLNDPAQAALTAFATEVARRGWTACFELTHPKARIVVAHPAPALRLLHVRDNITGAYLLLDPAHPLHDLLHTYRVPMVPRYDPQTLPEALATLPTMQAREGFVVQLASGDMVKLKCPWYLRLHRCITFLRERDLARLALLGELDDVKAGLTEAGVDLTPVLAIETRVGAILTQILEEIDRTVEAHETLDRKTFALRHADHPFFGLLMARYLGQPPKLVDWYLRHRLTQEFSLRQLTTETLADAL